MAKPELDCTSKPQIVSYLCALYEVLGTCCVTDSRPSYNKDTPVAMSFFPWPLCSEYNYSEI